MQAFSVFGWTSGVLVGDLFPSERVRAVRNHCGRLQQEQSVPKDGMRGWVMAWDGGRRGAVLRRRAQALDCVRKTRLGQEARSRVAASEGAPAPGNPADRGGRLLSRIAWLSASLGAPHPEGADRRRRVPDDRYVGPFDKRILDVQHIRWD